jgi:predicted transglutaminase-like cysteine proteinase
MVVYDYFAAPDRHDPWSRKIEYWQARERAERRGGSVPTPAAVAGPGERDPESAGVESLQTKYDAFLTDRKRTMAREVAEWIQQQARQHYVPDGPIDEWATLDETLRGNGDDCDGLELLTFNFLRDLGFPANEVYRAIVFRRSDGQHHMVTLWFEDTDDPWVIDPTGAMTSGMPRMSQVPGWAPLKIFSHDEDFTVRRETVARAPR